MKDLARAAEVALAAAREAADLVMRVYETPFEVQYKAKDDPVTRADRESNALLCDRLGHAFPGVPVVAEESEASAYAGFAQADAAWFVDPLDGTREFVARNGEFSVMIGLAVKGRAVIGVIVAPAWGRAFFGVVGDRAWEVAADGSRVANPPVVPAVAGGRVDRPLAVARVADGSPSSSTLWAPARASATGAPGSRAPSSRSGRTTSTCSPVAPGCAGTRAPPRRSSTPPGGAAPTPTASRSTTRARSSSTPAASWPPTGDFTTPSSRLWRRCVMRDRGCRRRHRRRHHGPLDRVPPRRARGDERHRRRQGLPLRRSERHETAAASARNGRARPTCS